FVRLVAARFEDRFLARNVVAFYTYVVILLGGLSGACSAFRGLTLRSSMLAVLAVVCVVGLAWHALLIFGAWRTARRAVRKLLAALSSRDAPQKPYSGVHRVFTVRVE